MSALLSRVRGAIGMGVSWAVGCGLLGFIPRWIFGIESDLPFGFLFAGLGFFAGVIFSVLLVLTQGRRRFDEISMPSVSAAGAAAGLLLAALFVRGVHYGPSVVAATVGGFSVASALCASGSLALARRAERQALGAGEPPERLSDGA